MGERFEDLDIQINTLIEYEGEYYYAMDDGLDTDDELKVVHEEYYKPESPDDTYTGSEYTWIPAYDDDDDIIISVAKTIEEMFPSYSMAKVKGNTIIKLK